jgi:chlorobactene glucosyltransferase
MTAGTILAALDLASAALLAAMLLVALWNLCLAPRLERAGEPRGMPLVSLLVPARNEAENLRAHLPLLLAQDWPRLEIVVLDDGSKDGTAEVVASFAADRPDRLRLVRGAPPAEGWLGKNWACRQLAAEARGDVLLFCDADVAPGPRAARRTVALLERWQAGAATAILRHRFGSWGERAVVPLVAQLPVAATLPLALVPRTKSPSLSMANGQWIAFTREVYDAIGGHAAVRADVLEDVALGRAVKRAGFRLVSAISTDEVMVRMYRGLGEVRAGFRKNLYALFGGSPVSFTLALAALLLTAVYPWAAGLRVTPSILAALAMLVALRCVAALTFRHGIATILLHPLGALLTAWIAVESAMAHRRGDVRWKGRRVVVAGATEVAATTAKSPPSRAPIV